MPVLAPCPAVVVKAVDGLPDMTVHEYDRVNMAGNHVILACGDVHIVMAHFRQSSVNVHVGDPTRGRSRSPKSATQAAPMSRTCIFTRSGPAQLKRPFRVIRCQRDSTGAFSFAGTVYQ
ncbi:MAG: hypothetical protein ABIP64_08585 [Burkholderiales bacterium]